MRLSTSLLWLMILTLAGLASAQEPVARLTAYSGDVSVMRAGRQLPLYPRLSLMNGDTIVTRKALAFVRFDDDSELRISDDSRVVISQAAKQRDIQVFAGRLWARIVSRRDSQTRFKTGGTIAAIRGTTIEYQVMPDGTVNVGVVEGEILVIFTFPDGSTQEQVVKEGESLQLPPGGPPGKPRSGFKEGDIAGDTSSPEEADLGPEIELKRVVNVRGNNPFDPRDPAGEGPTPPPATGACCLPNGSCRLESADSCRGQYRGDGSDCDSAECPQPRGACCNPDGSCTEGTPQSCRGEYRGNDTACENSACPQPRGACCLPDGSCNEVTAGACRGEFLGTGSDCASSFCPQPTGACCLPNGSCNDVTQENCGGEFRGDFSSCSNTLCPQPTGACCRPDGSCDDVTAASCNDDYRGNFSSCANTVCPQPGCDDVFVSCDPDASNCCTGLDCDASTQTCCVPVDGDCPTGEECCTGLSCVEGSCAECIPNGLGCVGDPNCCPGSVCDVLQDEETGCCTPEGGSCGATGECCWELQCIDGVCSSCDQLGAACDPQTSNCCPDTVCGTLQNESAGCCVPEMGSCASDADCCDFRSCVNGVCETPCDPLGTSCSPDLLDNCCPATVCGIGPNESYACCTPEGGSCTTGDDCCDFRTCDPDSNVCCSDTGQLCNPDGAACCAGNVCSFDGNNYRCCRPVSASCSFNFQCCSDNCVDGFCADPCIGLGVDCTPGATSPPFCCSGTRCDSEIARCCHDFGAQCTQDTDCCLDQNSLRCNQELFTCCVGLFGSCTQPSDCCADLGLTCDTGQGFCCVGAGAACASSTDCCGGLACFNNTCQFVAQRDQQLREPPDRRQPPGRAPGGRPPIGDEPLNPRERRND